MKRARSWRSSPFAVDGDEAGSVSAPARHPGRLRFSFIENLEL